MKFNLHRLTPSLARAESCWNEIWIFFVTLELNISFRSTKRCNGGSVKASLSKSSSKGNGLREPGLSCSIGYVAVLRFGDFCAVLTQIPICPAAGFFDFWAGWNLHAISGQFGIWCFTKPKLRTSLDHSSFLLPCQKITFTLWTSSLPEVLAEDYHGNEDCLPEEPYSWPHGCAC